MKISKKAGKTVIKMSKKEWEKIGKEAGFLKKSQYDQENKKRSEALSGFTNNCKPYLQNIYSIIQKEIPKLTQEVLEYLDYDISNSIKSNIIKSMKISSFYSVAYPNDPDFQKKSSLLQEIQENIRLFLQAPSTISAQTVLQTINNFS